MMQEVCLIVVLHWLKIKVENMIPCYWDFFQKYSKQERFILGVHCSVGITGLFLIFCAK